MARASLVQTIPRLQPPLPFPGASRPSFPHPNSFLATQSSVHLCTTQQNGRLATGEAEGTGSFSSQAQLLSKALSPQDPSKSKQERAPAQVPNHGPLACWVSRAHFHSGPVSRCPRNRCQARGPGTAWRGPRDRLQEKATSRGRKLREDEEGPARAGGKGWGQGCCLSLLPGGSIVIYAAPLTISRQTKAPE